MISYGNHRWNGLRIVGLMALLLASLSFPLPARAADFAAQPFRALWSQTDQDTSVPPVWGPQPNTDEVDEAYAEAPGGYRIVQYFDKGRMELNDPAIGRVSAGLLATELVTAQIQTGNAANKAAKPATVPVAGDPDNTFPTYANLATFRPSPPAGSATGPVTRLYNPDGTFGVRQEAASDPAAAYATTDGLTGHTVPAAFADFRNDPRHPLATIGLAITEPFWAKVKVGGVPKDVMIQAFERRVLTYTPSNPDGFKVEYGNIGRAYYAWRYPNGTAPVPAGNTTPVPSATSAPAPASGDIDIFALADPSNPKPDTPVNLTIKLTKGGAPLASTPFHVDVQFDMNVATVSVDGKTDDKGIAQVSFVTTGAIAGTDAQIVLTVNGKSYGSVAGLHID
jgi:hypothetical protein